MRHSFLHQSAGVWLAALLTAGAASRPAWSQPGPSGPPVVGFVEAVRRPVKESFEFMGRVQATDRVDLVARVNAFLDERFFTEGAEVKKGICCTDWSNLPIKRTSRPSRPPSLRQRRSSRTPASSSAARRNSSSRSRARKRGATTLTAQRSTAAQLRSAQAAERQSQINLGYTEIRAPIAGRIGRTAVTVGNVVGPSSGTLATIVSQDPMYVTFPVPMRTALDLRTRYAASGGFEAVAIGLRLPDGRIYGQTGTLNFADVSVGQDTDSHLARQHREPRPASLATRRHAPARARGR